MRRYSKHFHHLLYERKSEVREREAESCVRMYHINGYAIGIGKCHLMNKDNIPNKSNLQMNVTKR